ncbi:MAG TPA: hypothetical protein PLH79_07535 [bacterium]|nr:hypothetical protein [bacterium]
MKTMLSNKIGQLARAYWQPLVLATLMLLILSQLISWGVSVAELHKVDRLITETASVQPESGNPESPGAERTGRPDRPGRPGHPDDSGNPEGGGTPPSPAKNIFKQENVNYQLTAIYLNKAVINGQEVGVGDKVGGKATLEEIGVSSVVLKEDDGNTRTLSMFQGEGGGSPDGGGRSRPGMGGPRPGGGRDNRPGPNLPLPEVLQSRGLTREQLSNMSPEERRRMFMNLSPEERERARQQFMGRRSGN